ncbi:polysaccharide deacetylase family protein [Paenibacillus sp. sgz500958]|uniref:polysaccharide deacetylase family protein n=1 Tax=Paenibacillus sp. sgz500958 TaxID=3242475 RepID=UPI0036D2DD12
MGKQTAVLLLASMLLASCSGGGNSGNSANQANVQSPPPASQEIKASPSPVSTASTSPSPEATATAGISASPSPAADSGAASDSPVADGNEVQFLYHMNKNYDIIPNEEGTPKKVVLLTFDDGPKDPVMINSLMDTLDKHKAKAIFFVNGYRVKEHPELLKLIHERGGIIGNHSWDHIILKDKSEAEVKKQIESVQDIVKEVTGDVPVFFRPPHGAGGDVGKKIAAANDMLYMTWSVGSLDWEMKEQEAGKTGKLLQNVKDQLHSGSNILMHELPWTVEALDTLLTTLEGKGYSFVDPRSIELKMR